MRRFLFLSYHFAPIGGVGTQRQHHFVCNLERAGWAATVIARTPHRTLGIDESLLADLPASTQVHRIKPVDIDLLQRAFWKLKWNGAAKFVVGMYFPDLGAGWAPLAYLKGRRLLQAGGFDAVVSSGPPHSAHLAAMRLAREFGLPFLADFRDEWSDNPYAAFATPLHRTGVARLEHAVLARADRVLTVTNYCARRLAKRATPPGKVFTLGNGYSERSFPPYTYEPNPKFTIGYVGTFYGMNSPVYFFRALAELVASGRIPTSRVRFVHAGMGSYDVPPALEELVERRGFVAHLEATGIMQRVDMLMLTLPDPAPQSGKIFEYLRAGRPVLAITPPAGALAELVNETRGGDVVAPDDHAGICAAIERRYHDWEAGGRGFAPDLEKVRQYDWARLAEKFGQHLDAVAKR